MSKLKVGDKIIAIHNGMEGLRLRRRPDLAPIGQVQRQEMGLNPDDSKAVGVGPFDYLVGDRGTIIGIHWSGSLAITKRVPKTGMSIQALMTLSTL